MVRTTPNGLTGMSRAVEDLEEDPGEELEAMISQADRLFASESFGTTAQEQEEGETLEQRL